MRLLLALLLAAPLVTPGPDGHLRFVPGGTVAKGVAAAPRLISGVPAPVLARINAAMAKVDERGRSSAADCRASLRERKDLPHGDDDGWTRDVKVAFTGPRLFAILIQDSYYCGGPYPARDDQALVFDLSTGRPVDWRPLFPPALHVQTTTDTAGDGAALGFFKATSALVRLMGPLDEECRDGLEGRYFMVWPDRAAGGLVLGLRGFPHVRQACEEDVTLTPAKLRHLGFAGALVDAISRPGH